MEKEMKIGIYPGSFDPVTKGHLDIIERSSKMVLPIITVLLCFSRMGKEEYTVNEPCGDGTEKTFLRAMT